MSQNFGYYATLNGATFSEQDHTGWLHAMAPGKYHHPKYGELDLGLEKIKAYADSVNNNVRGIELDIDYDHKEDATKGREAAGWVKKAEVRNDGLWLFVEWTKTAFEKIKEKAYKYFSPEFASEWQDPKGVTYTDVLFGGGITNRPYLKNLLPLNLSELSFGEDGEGGKKDPQDDKGDEVDMKKLREALGLAETITDEDVWKTFGERLKAAPPAPTPEPVKEDPKPEPVKYALGEDLRKLAETNPAVKDLLGFVEQLVETNKENASQLRETAVTARLNELDTSSLIMVKAAKDLAHDIAMALTEKETQDKFFQLLSMMRDNQGVLVELGERGKASTNGYVRDRSAEAAFNELVAKKMAENTKMQYADAVELVAGDNRKLYEQYREEVRLVKTA
jgi:hypothetical protein